MQTHNTSGCWSVRNCQNRSESRTILSFIDGQGPLQQFLLLLDVSQAIVGIAQVRERGGHIAVVRPKLSFLAPRHAVTVPPLATATGRFRTVLDFQGLLQMKPLLRCISAKAIPQSQARSWIDSHLVDEFDIQLLDRNEWTIPESVE